MMRLFYCGNSRVMSVNILTPERGGKGDVLQSGFGPPPSLYGYSTIALLCCDHSNCRITIFLLIIFIPVLLSVLKSRQTKADKWNKAGNVKLQANYYCMSYMNQDNVFVFIL